MDNNKLVIKVNSGLEKVSKQIAITNKLLNLIDPPLIPYRKKDKWGFCTPDKKIEIDCIYDDTTVFSEGLASVKTKGKWMFINKSGIQVIPYTFYETSIFSEGLVAVKLNHRLGYIDSTGKQIIPCVYENSIWDNSSFSEGLAAVQFKGKWGFIDKFGTQVIPFTYFGVLDVFFNGIACVELADDSDGYDSKKFEDSWSTPYIDKSGKVVNIDPNNDFYFREGLRSYAVEPPPDFEEPWKFGFVDKSYNVVIPCIYSTANNFSEGLAAVKLNNRWGFINKMGTQVIPCIYDKVEDFFNSLSKVKLNGKRGYIDKRGTQFWED